jgi:hypothetical protein
MGRVIMTVRGNSYPIYFGRGVFFSRIALFLILCLLNFKPVLAQEAPVLYGISPSEGHLGEELRLVLDGNGFSQLDNLTNINISGTPIPFSDYEIIDDQTIMVILQIPEQSSIGEQQIAFIFDNEFRLEAPFVILGAPGPARVQPLLNGVSPQEGRPGEQLPVTLDGGGFSNLGELQAVYINGVDAPLMNYNLASDQAMEVLVRIPEDAPPGEGDITFSFENGDLNAYFNVTEPGAPPPEEPGSASIREVSPLEGRAGSELSLRLNGENLSGLGDLQSVDINGRDIPIVNYQMLSDQAVATRLTIPADIPAGVGQIAFFFDNSTFEAPFTLLAVAPPPPDPIIVIFIIAGVIGFIGTIGFVGRRLFRRPKPRVKSPPQQQPALATPQIYFKTHLEPGSQSVETTGPSIKANIEIRLVTKIDYGVQSVEVEHDSLTAEQEGG